jgi:hypothetical protein
MGCCCIYGRLAERRGFKRNPVRVGLEKTRFYMVPCPDSKTKNPMFEPSIRTSLILHCLGRILSENQYFLPSPLTFVRCGYRLDVPDFVTAQKKSIKTDQKWADCRFRFWILDGSPQTLDIERCLLFLLIQRL